MTLIDTPQETGSQTAEPSIQVPRASAPTAVERLVGSGDHQLVGRVLAVGGLLFLAFHLITGAMADFQVASDGTLLNSSVADRFGVNSVFGVLLGGAVPLILGVAIAAVPRQIGAASLALPRAAAAAVWTWWGSAIVFVVAELANGSYGGDNLKAARLGNLALGGMLVAVVLASITVVTTVVAYRAEGLGLADVPFFAFSTLLGASVWIFTLPVLFTSIVLAQISHSSTETLATSVVSGMGWVVVPPAVFMVIVPILGAAIDAASTAASARTRFRGPIQAALGAYAVGSLGGWAVSDAARQTFLVAGFAILTLVTVLPVLAGVADTLRGGRIKFVSPLAFGVLSLLLALLAGLIGLLLAVNTAGSGTLVDVNGAAYGGLFRLAIGTATIGALGAAIHWARFTFGYSVLELGAKGLAPLAALGTLLWAVPMVVAGVATDVDVTVLSGVAGVGAVLLAVAVLATLLLGGQAIAQARRGDELLGNVWGTGTTLEWADSVPFPTSVESPYPLLDATGKADS